MVSPHSESQIPFDVTLIFIPEEIAWSTSFSPGHECYSGSSVEESLDFFISGDFFVFVLAAYRTLG